MYAATPFSGTPTTAIPDPAKTITAVRAIACGLAEQRAPEVLARHGMVATSQRRWPRRRACGSSRTAATRPTRRSPPRRCWPDRAGKRRHRRRHGGHLLRGEDASPVRPERRRVETASHMPAFYRSRGLEVRARLRRLKRYRAAGRRSRLEPDLHRFGRMSLDKVLQPSSRPPAQDRPDRAIRATGRATTASTSTAREDPESGEGVLRDGHVPPLYSIFRNPETSPGRMSSWRRTARGPSTTGRSARDRAPHDAGGADWKLSDLSSFRSQWVNRSRRLARAVTTSTRCRPRRRVATLQMLNILQACGPRTGYDLRALGPLGGVLEHPRPGQAARRVQRTSALQRRSRFVHIPLKRLISKSYAASLCSRIDLTHAPAAQTVPREQRQNC